MNYQNLINEIDWQSVGVIAFVAFVAYLPIAVHRLIGRGMKR